MAYDASFVARARQLYLSGCNLDSIAQTLGASVGTITRWKATAKRDGDDWDRLKTAYALKDGEPEDISRDILRLALIEFKLTLEELHNAEMPPAEKAGLLTKMADAHTKLTSSSRKLLPETMKLVIALGVLDLLAKYLAEHQPDLLGKFAAILEPFGKRLPELLPEVGK